MNGIPNGTLPSSLEIRSASAVDADPPITCTTNPSGGPDPGPPKKVVAPGEDRILGDGPGRPFSGRPTAVPGVRTGLPARAETRARTWVAGVHLPGAALSVILPSDTHPCVSN